MRTMLQRGLIIAIAAALASGVVASLPNSALLGEGGVLTGSVWNDLDSDNQPDAGENRVGKASVQAKPLGGTSDQPYATTTGDDGGYSLSLPEGSWSVFAFYYVQASRSMTYTLTAADVLAGQTTNLDLGLHHPTARAWPTSVEAKIEILWPHDRQGRYQPVAQAELANIGVYLFQPGTDAVVPCDFDPAVHLWRAYNNQVADLIGQAGRREEVSVDGKRFIRWLFDDVDVSAARDPLSKVFFYVTVDGVSTYHNVWSHGADARTYFPEQDRPTGVAGGDQQPGPVDARIEIVWPHDQAGNPGPVDQATLVNIGVDLYQHGTLRSVSPGWNPTIKLYRALNNGAGVLVASGGIKTLVAGSSFSYPHGSFLYPRWVFNDINVSQARDPMNKYYFCATVDGVTTYSNVWSHGADARTYFPTQDIPGAGCQ